LALSRGNKMYMLGLVAVYWAIWLVTGCVLIKKHIKSAPDIIISVCFLCGIGQVSTLMNTKR
jgi:hypothetical protein